ncbi:single-stranded DNA-binding protein [Feifania hominis]|uniref:Single-stranded DNA-binding protein n=1 Tax=Feifania hominis TaxID=2763660 RepID=A0A926HW41_9FIRM|nr:single-stranded DNA-binding protein [Feifania hominis]MBC8537291.1 single-stranded DNA-binding protein [Feifania hominis]
MLNRVILMGRLTATPELKETPNGVAVCAFTLALERNFKGRDGNRQTDFIDIVAWRSTAEFVARYFDKGMQVAVEGTLQTRSYEDRQGNKRKVAEVAADQVYFADRRRGEKQGQDFEDIVLTDDGDLPF